MTNVKTHDSWLARLNQCRSRRYRLHIKDHIGLASIGNALGQTPVDVKQLGCDALNIGISELQQRIARLTAHAHNEACHMELQHVTVYPAMSGTLAIEFPVTF